ncbi:MAG: tetratricopeptide repeat protein, partial [Bacteroidota bacterium]
MHTNSSVQVRGKWSLFIVILFNTLLVSASPYFRTTELSDSTVFATRLSEARQYFKSYQYDSARIVLYPNLQPEATGASRNLMIDSYALLVNVFWNATQYDSAAIYAEKGLQIQGLSSKQKTQLLYRLADSHYRRSVFDQSVEMCYKVLEVIKQQPYEGSDYRAFTTYQLLGLVHIEMDQFDMARDYFRYCLDHFNVSSKENLNGLQAYG